MNGARYIDSVDVPTDPWGNAYLYWTNGGQFINLGDPAHPWPAFADFSAGFYESEAARGLFLEYVEALVQRTNSVTGRAYRDDPAIMAWQLANEPRPGYRNERGFARLPAYNNWVAGTAALLAPPQQLGSLE